MCGIVGVVGREDAAFRLLDSLKRLEYRGYDSSGIATIHDGVFDRRRAEGKLTNLEKILRENPLVGHVGIGHTRWATHGAPTERNAHPHQTENVVLVHNGIIENFKELREELEKAGRCFETETDTEVVAHLICSLMSNGKKPEDAVKETLERLEGAFALAILVKGESDLMFGARQGSPLVLGLGDGEMFLGSDAIALAPMTNRIIYLEEGDWVRVNTSSYQIFDRAGKEVKRSVVTVAASTGLIDKGNYRHYMQKEIHEQPTVVGQTLATFIDPLRSEVRDIDVPFDWTDITRLTLIACGTSYYAAMTAKYWFEQLAHLSVDVDVASEFRYRQPVMTEGGLSLFISQSGETADTLAALRHAKECGQHIAGIINVPMSTMAREADVVFPTHAGPEIGVASTKAYTCQLAVLLGIAIAAGKARGVLSKKEEHRIVKALGEVPSRMAEALKAEDAMIPMCHKLATARDVLYLGRGLTYPVALEGALKLKEISYIHAEGYASGEMKHGPIALIDKSVPVMVLAPSNDLFDKTVSNMHEVIAREGQVVMVSDKKGLNRAGDAAKYTVSVPLVEREITPLIFALPMQLMAYHIAVHKGTDVDQPRNLAKSVTVE